MNDTRDLDPRGIAERLVLRWPVIFLAGLGGALLAMALGLALPPRYEASASLGISIDYGRTPPLELIVEDRALNRAAGLVTSAATIDRVGNSLEARFGENPAWSSRSALKGSMRVDSILAEWRLVVAGRDPEIAATIANVWAEIGLDELETASDHAWEALRIQSAPIVVACSELLVGASLESYWQCLAAGPNLTADQVSRLQEETRLSRGVLPILSFELLDEASPPQEPVAWSRTPLVVSGMLIGLGLGAVLAGAGFPRRKSADETHPQVP